MHARSVAASRCDAWAQNTVHPANVARRATTIASSKSPTGENGPPSACAADGRIQHRLTVVQKARDPHAVHTQDGENARHRSQVHWQPNPYPGHLPLTVARITRRNYTRSHWNHFANCAVLGWLLPPATRRVTQATFPSRQCTQPARPSCGGQLGQQARTRTDSRR